MKFLLELRRTEGELGDTEVRRRLDAWGAAQACVEYGSEQ